MAIAGRWLPMARISAVSCIFATGSRSRKACFRGAFANHLLHGLLLAIPWLSGFLGEITVPMRVLVTGGAGFLGSHLCDRLLKDGCEVVCIDNLVTGSLDNLRDARAHERFTFINQNVEEPLPEGGFAQIYNLACPASPPRYQIDPIATMRASVFGAANILEYAARNGTRVLQASTSEIYGDPDLHPQHEEYVGSVNCAGRRACYDEGKRAAETMFYDYHRQLGVEIRVARIFNTYGPRLQPDDGRVISNFIAQALRGEDLTVYGEGRQTRSFCYVDDLIDGLIRLMNAEGCRVGPLNLGNPAEYAIRDIASIILKRTGSGSKLKFMPLPEDDPKIRRPDIGKAEAALGWRPTIGLEEGLDRTIAWQRSMLRAGADAGWRASIEATPADFAV